MTENPQCVLASTARVAMVLAVLFWPSCQSTMKSDRNTQIAIQDLIGATTNNAIDEMTKLGYECVRVESGSFMATIKQEGRSLKRRHNDISFIRCTRSSSIGLVNSYHSVALVLNTDGVICAVLENWDHYGP